MKCPKCGRHIKNLPEDETLFIDNAIRTMQHYKKDHGFYRPNGLFIGNFAMQMFSNLYTFFDYLEQKKPTNKLELETIHGMGPARIMKYGDEILDLINFS